MKSRKICECKTRTKIHGVVLNMRQLQSKFQLKQETYIQAMRKSFCSHVVEKS